MGECTEDDIDEISKLVLTDPRCDVPDFSSRDWQDVILVTPRHSLRKEWNNRALRKHCGEGGHRIYSIRAKDTDKTTGETPRLDFRVAIAQLGEKKTGKLEDKILIAKGMKVMVMTNIATEADVANGTRGIIENFWLHPDEQPTQDEQGCIILQYMPPVIFFRPMDKAAVQFQGVETGLIPITPSVGSFKAINGLGEERQFKREQYALTGAYAFTDYKAQGQTIGRVVIDIGMPPNGSGLSPFNAYVALSRGLGRQAIRLLRPFNPDIFTTHPSEELRVDMIRLRQLDEQTTQDWNNRQR